MPTLIELQHLEIPKPWIVYGLRYTWLFFSFLQCSVGHSENWLKVIKKLDQLETCVIQFMFMFPKQENVSVFVYKQSLSSAVLAKLSLLQRKLPKGLYIRGRDDEPELEFTYNPPELEFTYGPNNQRCMIL